MHQNVALCGNGLISASQKLIYKKPIEQGQVTITVKPVLETTCIKRSLF